MHDLCWAVFSNYSQGPEEFMGAYYGDPDRTKMYDPFVVWDMHKKFKMPDGYPKEGKNYVSPCWLRKSASVFTNGVKPDWFGNGDFADIQKDDRAGVYWQLPKLHKGEHSMFMPDWFHMESMHIVSHLVVSIFEQFGVLDDVELAPLHLDGQDKDPADWSPELKKAFELTHLGKDPYPNAPIFYWMRPKHYIKPKMERMDIIDWAKPIYERYGTDLETLEKVAKPTTVEMGIFKVPVLMPDLSDAPQNFVRGYHEDSPWGRAVLISHDIFRVMIQNNVTGFYPSPIVDGVSKGFYSIIKSNIKLSETEYIHHGEAGEIEFKPVLSGFTDAMRDLESVDSTECSWMTPYVRDVFRGLTSMPKAKGKDSLIWFDYNTRLSVMKPMLEDGTWMGGGWDHKLPADRDASYWRNEQELD